MNNIKESDLLEQLSIAFGEKKAKELINEIKRIKKQNPGVNFEFIFGEDGELTTRKKIKGE